MARQVRLTLIKIIHTLVWLFFNVVIFYMLYAAIVGKIDRWLWMGYGLFILEGLVLICFRFYCPLTLLAKKYFDSSLPNFDIYLPQWLAKHNKVIYSGILGFITIVVVIRLLI